jgi:hypothetical protein
MTWDTVITHVKFNAENGKHWSTRNRIHLGSVMLTSLINLHDVSAGAIALAEDANAVTCKGKLSIERRPLIRNLSMLSLELGPFAS